MSAPALSTARILVIDDDAEVRYSLNRVLSGQNFAVIEAAEQSSKTGQSIKPQHE